MIRKPKRRRGATLVESALALPILFLFIFGTVVCGLGTLRFQQVASIAREASRWASMHGGQYASETGQPAATGTDVYNQAIRPLAGMFDPNRLTYTVAWDDNSKNPIYWDAAAKVWRRNQVAVTLNYNWVPEMFLPPQTMSSTSRMPVTY
jgi:Flp pilus assembly protein TadG